MRDQLDLLIAKLAKEGGCIVSSADCGEIEIANAQARGDFYVDEQHHGYVRRLPEWLRKKCEFARSSKKRLSVVKP